MENGKYPDICLINLNRSYDLTSPEKEIQD